MYISYSIYLMLLYKIVRKARFFSLSPVNVQGRNQFCPSRYIISLSLSVMSRMVTMLKVMSDVKYQLIYYYALIIESDVCFNFQFVLYGFLTFSTTPLHSEYLTETSFPYVVQQDQYQVYVERRNQWKIQIISVCFGVNCYLWGLQQLH